MSLFDDLLPMPTRGVLRLDVCLTCDGTVPVMGRVGEGVPLAQMVSPSTRLCHGHAIRACHR